MTILLEPVGLNRATSGALALTPVFRKANPFDLSTLTLTEVTAATTQDWSGFYVTVFSSQRGIVSIATGAPGAETRIASLPTESQLIVSAGFNMFVPVAIAAGTRISAGVSLRTSGATSIQIAGVPASLTPASPSFTVMDCGPFLLSGTSSTYGSWPTMDPGGVANTVGPWTEISLTGGNNDNNVLNGNALAHAYDYFGKMFADTGTFQTTQSKLYDLASGPVGGEDTIFAGVADQVLSSEMNVLHYPFFTPFDRPVGTRLSARMQSSIIDPTDRVGACLMFGLR